MHERVDLTRQGSVVDEKVFFDGELRIKALKVAGAIVAHTMAQGEILGARGRGREWDRPGQSLGGLWRAPASLAQTRFAPLRSGATPPE